MAAGVVASLLATRIRVPALVLFLGLGLAIGTDGLGWINFDDYAFARLIGTIALLLILYEGGLAPGSDRCGRFWALLSRSRSSPRSSRR